MNEKYDCKHTKKLKMIQSYAYALLHQVVIGVICKGML
jgi:hypothetical protein